MSPAVSEFAGSRIHQQQETGTLNYPIQACMVHRLIWVLPMSNGLVVIQPFGNLRCMTFHLLAGDAADGAREDGASPRLLKMTVE